jgi:hypothetical protein
MEEEMEELCIESLANHDDREPCAGAREGAGEASVAARAGHAIEPRNHTVRGADAVYGSGRKPQQVARTNPDTANCPNTQPR